MWQEIEMIQISCTRFTVAVYVNSDGMIVDAAPLVRKFVGQPFINLTRWVRRFDNDPRITSIERTILLSPDQRE